jgi:hypothetical protein
MSQKTAPRTATLVNLATGQEAKTRLIEVAPGQWTAPAIEPDDVPRYGIVRMMRQTDGRYLPVLKHYGQYVRMSRDLPEQLGFRGLSSMTLYRLCSAGFVCSSKPGPGVILVDVLSLAEHIEAARDPEFWTPERRKCWSDACASVQSNRFLRDS